MTMQSGNTSNLSGTMPIVGARVLTIDGQDLGEVKEVAGNCFKVDVTMQPDYWLGTDTVASAGATDVRLNITKDRVGDFKVDGPQHGGVHHHNA
jgi:sporulation protein YlmC with PRC-barrel domain